MKRKNQQIKKAVSRPLKIAFHTLGCKVNQYESQAIAQDFALHGYELVSEDEPADVYLINTCSVTHLADRKSRQFIRRAKKISPDAAVVALGCYAQLEPETLAGIEGVSLVIGTNQKHKIRQELEQYLRDRQERVLVLPYKDLDDFVELEFPQVSEDRSRAYLKVQEGCDRFCSYCIIPYARGTCRTRSFEEIIKEARHLVDLGFQEIVLTGINTALCECLSQVISELSSWKESFRIRLSSLEPTVVDADFVSDLLPYEKLCHHLHLSVQSGSDTVIQRMNRRYRADDYRKIVGRLKEFDPLYGITTDLIVGFPGESEEEFEETLRLVEEIDFCRIHIFKYSKRHGTPAAEMEDQLPESVKRERVKSLEKAAKDASSRFIQANIGSQAEVLIEEFDRKTGLAVGYTGNYIRAYIDFKNQETLCKTGRLVHGIIDSAYRDGVRVNIEEEKR